MEFATKKEIASELLGGGFLGSKGQYRSDHPLHCVIFNSNICTAVGKIWHGDMDLTLTSDKLSELAKRLNETIFVLYEMDARFEHEKEPLLDKAPVCFTSEGSIIISEEAKSYIEIKDGTLTLKPEPAPTAEKLAVKLAYKKKEAEKYKEAAFEKISKIDWDYLTKFSKNKNTLEKFWEFLAGATEAQHCMDFNILEEDNDKLQNILIQWIAKAYKGITPYRAKSNASWVMLERGPSVFFGDPAWVEQGTIYKKIKPSSND